MQLPYSENLNIGYLSRLFDNTSNCYKFFWFRAILNKLTPGQNRFTFGELINEMIADAWYMVTEYHLRLGPVGVTDNLEEAVKYIYQKESFTSSEKREKILDYLEGTTDKKISYFKSQLTLNVPYRLQTPFFDSIQIERETWYRSKDILTDEINRQSRLMYYFVMVNGLNSVIEADENWGKYLLEHREIINGWLQFKLIHYLQAKNPNVPGIADKIEPPMARKIERVRKYWDLIVEISPDITDIYGNVLLKNEVISVDHFVPWQYVAHDELWNLHPTTRSINSSKNNSLAAWDRYFGDLSEIEYRAYELKEQNEIVRAEFAKISPYHLNNQEIRDQLYAEGLSRSEFKQRLEHVLRPVYDSAKTCGFKEWIYQ